MLCTVVRVERSETVFYQVLAPQTSVETEAADEQESTPPVITLLGDWAYMVGDEPELRTFNGTAVGAHGSQMVVQVFPGNASGPSKIRAVLLASQSRDPTGWIEHDTASEEFDEGQYVDADFDSSGQFTGFSTPATFDPENPPTGSENLMETVETEKDARGLP
jgi:hypothetical protein